MERVKAFFGYVHKQYFVVPPRNDSFKCPRCNSRKWYRSTDGYVEHSNSYGATWRGADITNIRCKECTTVMVHYMNPDHIAWQNRCKITGAIIGAPLLLAVVLMISSGVYDYLMS
jgi:phage FluMu protein Com